MAQKVEKTLFKEEDTLPTRVVKSVGVAVGVPIYVAYDVTVKICNKGYESSIFGLEFTYENVLIPFGHGIQYGAKLLAMIMY